MNKKWIALFVVLILVAGPIIHFGLNSNPMMPSEKVLEGEAFEGVVTNTKDSIGSFMGTGVYDRNCVDAGKGLTNCDAGIETVEFGILNFNYIHNMMAKPCIKSGDKLLIEVVDDSGSAFVQRTM